jgi:hypothetical protein
MKFHTLMYGIPLFAVSVVGLAQTKPAPQKAATQKKTTQAAVPKKPKMLPVSTGAAIFAYELATEIKDYSERPRIGVASRSASPSCRTHTRSIIRMSLIARRSTATWIVLKI